MGLTLNITYSEFKSVAQTYSLQVYKEVVFTSINIACFSGGGPNTIMYRVDGLMAADLDDFNSTFGGTAILVSTLDDQYAAQTFLSSPSFIGETVSITDGYHSPAILNSTPIGTEYALAVRQVGGGGNSNIFDSYGNDLTSTAGSLNVNVTDPVSIGGLAASGSPTSGSPVLVAGSDGANVRTLHTDSSGNLLTTFTPSFVAAPNTVLPADTAWMGASDGTNLQGLLVESASNKNLRTSIFYQGNELIIGNDGYTSVHQIGTWTVQQGSPPWSVSQSGGWTVTANQGTSPWVVSGTVAATQSGSWTTTSLLDDGYGNPLQSTLGALNVNVNNAITANQGTNPWTVGGTVNVGNTPSVTVSSGTITANQGTSPWTVSGTVTANQGGSWTTTSLLQDGYGNDLTSVGGALKVSGHSLTGSASSSVIVSNSAVLIIASNPQRKSLIISNNGTTNIYLGATNTIASSGANMGIKILPNGTYMDSGIDTYTGDIYGVGDGVSASHNVAVWERT